MIENNKALVIDCQASGIAGDMVLGALIDLGANVDKIVDAIKTLENPAYGYKKIKIQVKQVMRGEFKSTNIDVTSEKANKKLGTELIEIVEDATSKLQLSTKAKEFAHKVIRTLVNTEEKLHKTEFYDGVLDEVSLVDTASEIIGTAVALDDLGLFEAKIYSTPVAVGGGTIKISHGIIPSPAPATLAILQTKHFPFHGGPIAAELATPTGVSILTNLIDNVCLFYPAIVPLKVGYGAGTKDFDGLPDVLRLIYGQTIESKIVHKMPVFIAAMEEKAEQALLVNKR
jgi:pyridinium-3,5-bisthiocarboxylic acid mononucleotide nickel chelatase